MTDYFALLDQHRAAWLDPDALKEIFHRKTLTVHPDANPAQGENEFAVLNEAYQVLRDPKRRLRHLLELQGSAPTSADPVVPTELQELFLRIGAANQRAKVVADQFRAASSALSRSLLKTQSIAVKRELEELRREVGEQIGNAEHELREVSAERTEAISALHSRFAYLGRWLAQLDELAFQSSELFI